MKATVAPTDKIVHLNGIPARLWQGHTETGIPVCFYVTRVMPLIEKTDPRQAEFELALQETETPRPEIRYIPPRMVL